MICIRKIKAFDSLKIIYKQAYHGSILVVFCINAFFLTTANAQDNSMTINQIGEKFTFIGFQIGSQNTLTGQMADSRLNPGESGAVLYSAQAGSGNTINFSMSSTGSALSTEALFALEQKGNNNIKTIEFSGENVEISTLQSGDGTSISITGNAENLLLKSSQSGSEHAATMQLDTGSYDINFEQSGLGKKVAEIDLENTGGGTVTVDWSQTGAVADTNTLIFSCGSALGCDLSYQD